MASTTMTDRWASLGSLMASAMFVWAVISQHFPGVAYLEAYLKKYSRRLFSFFYPYIQVTLPEFSGERMKRSEAYTAIEAYLSSTSSQSATRLKADLGKDSSGLTLSMDECEEVTGHFCGAKLWWNLVSRSTPQQSFSLYPPPDARRYYKLSFHRRHRDLVVNSYLDHVLREGRELGRLIPAMEAAKEEAEKAAAKEEAEKSAAKEAAATAAGDDGNSTDSKVEN